jgi:hypothetical protein
MEDSAQTSRGGAGNEEYCWQAPDCNRLNGMALLLKPSTGKRHMPAATLSGLDREFSPRLKLPVTTWSR